MISKELLELLVCPLCRKALVLMDEKLICMNCKKEYMIEDSIPIMLPEMAKDISIDN